MYEYLLDLIPSPKQYMSTMRDVIRNKKELKTLVENILLQINYELIENTITLAADIRGVKDIDYKTDVIKDVFTQKGYEVQIWTTRYENPSPSRAFSLDDDEDEKPEYITKWMMVLRINEEDIENV